MNLLRCYHALPAPCRSVVASLRGYQLRWWRYGRATDVLVAEALEREQWSEKQWQSWQAERLTRILHRAATRIPYYLQIWATRRAHGDNASWEELVNWPILEKETVRQNPRAFLADDVDPRSMFHEHTSGTAGKPLNLWFSRQTVQAWYALAEARWRRWYAVDRHDRWAILGGQLVTPVTQRHAPFWVWNRGLRQLYLSSYHLAPDLIPAYLDALHYYKPLYLLGYTSSLNALAHGILASGQRPPPLKVVLTNAEPLLDCQRQVIATAFACPVRETYGMSEAVGAASECQAGRLHVWPEAGVLEIVQDNQGVKPGEAGDILWTGLLNPDMPLIRYRVGDRARFPVTETECPCGRRLPVIASVEGRVDDVLFTADGRSIGRLDPVFKGDLPVREAQVIQETLERFRVKYVPAPGFTSIHARIIRDRLRERIGEVEVVLEAVAEIPRGPNNKFRAVICEIPWSDRRFLMQQPLRKQRSD